MMLKWGVWQRGTSWIRGFAGLRWLRCTRAITALNGSMDTLMNWPRGGIAAAQIHRFSTSVNDDPGSLKNLHAFISLLPYPVAIFSVNDWMSYKINRYCWTESIQVPSQVAILGVDNDASIAEMGNASLSSIELDGERIGRAAAHLIDEGLRTGEWAFREILIPPVGVVERKSTENIAVEDEVTRAAPQIMRDKAILGIEVEDVCMRLSITRKTLERRFQQHIGRSPRELIQQLRIQYARRLLRETGEKLESVAFICGYSEVRTFTRDFSRIEGTTASSYRKRFRQ